MKNLLLWTILFFAVRFCSGQAIEEPTQRKFALSIQAGVLTLTNPYFGTLGDFKRLAPDAELLKGDFSDFSKNFTSASSSNSYFSLHFTADALMKRSNWSRLNPKLQLGITAASVSLFNGNMTNTTTQLIDTLTSSATGASFLVDSINSKTYSLDYYKDIIALNGAFTVGTNTESTWSVYGGVAVSIGLVYNASVDLFYTEEISYSSGVPVNGSFPDQDLSFQNEAYKQDALSLNMIFAMPIGINLRLSKTREIWKDFSTFLELRPALTYIGSTQIDQNFFSSNFVGIGVRYQLLP